jgi:predicted thioesterase
MEPNIQLKPGLRAEKTETVTAGNTAEAWGSGGLPVYATPAMIALMEGAAAAAVQEQLPQGFSTVGTELNVKHLSASPLGMEIRALGELTGAEGRRLRFKVEAYDRAGKIGEGFHERFIIENESFLKKTREKSASR